METPHQNLERVRERIGKAAQRAGRDSASITLLAVTKTIPFEKVLPYLQAGIRHIGENRVQDALTKYSMPSPPWGEGKRPKMHLIGPLQSNKAKKAVEFFDLIQSLDRWTLAVELDRHAANIGKIQDCLIQIKISDEPSKSGLEAPALPEFLDKLRTLPHLAVRGLMGIPPLSATGDASRPYFAVLRKLFEEASRALSSKPGTQTAFDVLSMGMSADFEIAIEEGATLVRLGTVLFGHR